MKFRFRFPIVAALFFALLIPAVAKPVKMHDVADTINANVILGKFAQMVQAADLGTFLSSRGPFTVFVPTDSAFSRLPPGEFETLLRPENKERLQIIVLFHVVNGKRLTSKDLLLLKTTLSCQGSPLTFRTARTGTQFVMKAKISHADIRCSNGNIAEIDSMLMPPDSVLPPIAAVPPPAAISNQVTQVAPDGSTNAPATDTSAIPVAPSAGTNSAVQ